MRTDLEAVAAETGVDLTAVQRVVTALSANTRREPELVTLRHPKLPAGQVIEVDRRRIGARLASGWREVEAPTAEAEPAEPSEQPAEADPADANEQPAPEPEKPRRPRRTKSEEQ